MEETETLTKMKIIAGILGFRKLTAPAPYFSYVEVPRGCSVSQDCKLGESKEKKFNAKQRQ